MECYCQQSCLPDSSAATSVEGIGDVIEVCHHIEGVASYSAIGMKAILSHMGDPPFGGLEFIYLGKDSLIWKRGEQCD
jgi:hypothetical protein